MCYFNGRELLKILDIPYDQAIIAYKVVKIGPDGMCWSPIKHVRWDRRKHRSPIPTVLNTYGIYAMHSKSGAEDAGGGGVLVKVKLYGKVLKYRNAKDSYFGGRKYAGYRAEYAEIIEIVGVPLYMCSKDIRSKGHRYIDRALKRYPKLIDGRKP